MSLLVWIPMVHGDCKDQGLLGVETSVINTVTYVDGKLGKAAQIGNGNQVTNGIQINTNLVEELGTQYSCSVWIKPLGNHVHYEGAIISSGDWNKKCWAFGVNQDNSKVDIFCGGYNRNVTCSVPINQWTHLVSVNDGVYVNLYKNGELVSTTNASSWPLDSDATNTTIGRETYANGYFSFNGCIQDLRIYNHALSPLEVKHLAQGLVLHYPLNRGGFGADNLDNFSSMASNWVMESLNGSNYTDSFYGNVIKLVTNNTNQRMYHSVSNLWQSGQVYTVSFMAKADINGRTCNMSRSLADFSPSFTLTTNWERYSGKITSTATPGGGTLSFTINQSGATVYITQIKLEKGDVATPYTPAPSDDLYSQMGLDNNIEYDVSGYGNNGTRNGTFNWSGDTQRYSVSTVFDGSNYISRTSLTADILTFSCWVKTSKNKSTSQIIVADSTSQLCISFYAGTIITFYGSSGYGAGSKCILGNEYKENDWNHIVVVKTGTNTRKVYCNGIEQVATSNDYWASQSTGFTVGRRETSTPNIFYGQLSDLRVYATALSADDVMALYKNAGYVDSGGNVYAYEMTE